MKKYYFTLAAFLLFCTYMKIVYASTKLETISTLRHNSLERRLFKKRLPISDCEIFVNRIAGPIGLKNHGFTATNCCDKGFWNKYIRPSITSVPRMIICDEQKTHIREIHLKSKLGIATGHYIPPEMSLLKRLVHLDLSYNWLGREIPSELGYLTSLRVLNLWSNVLSGDIPTTLGRLTHLEILNLRGNALTGRIPVELSHLTHIREMSMIHNRHLDLDHIPQGILNLQNLPQSPRLDLGMITSPAKKSTIAKVKKHMVKLTADSEHECAICMEKMVAGQLVLTGKLCGHQFHGDCASTWIVDKNKNSCPLCRQPLI